MPKESIEKIEPEEKSLTGEGKKEKKDLGQTFEVIVDYNRSLAEMLEAGKYDWVDDDITADHFPLKGKGEHELSPRLFHFNSRRDWNHIFFAMKYHGYRPGTIEELLALGEKYPDLQKEFPIAALGSVWRVPHGRDDVVGRADVASLEWSKSGRPQISGRSVFLNSFYDNWDTKYRFIAIPKEKKEKAKKGKEEKEA